MAAKKVPLTTRAQVPKPTTSDQLPCRSKRAQTIEHDEQRRHERFEHAHENKIAQRLRQKQGIRRRGRNAVGIEHLVANLSRPCLVQCHHGCEEKCHPDRPPAIWRDSSALGSKEKLNTTTTRREKNSMELMASFDLHSRRRSLSSVARVMPVGAVKLWTPVMPWTPVAELPSAGYDLAGFHPDEFVGGVFEQDA